jgi:branched-chain amino acid transport system permease protein
MKINFSSRETRLGLFVVFVTVGFVSYAFWGQPSGMNALTEFFYLLALAQLWNLLAGYAGLVSVGQQAWLGIGGYAMLILADDFGVPLWAAVVLAGVVAAIVSLPTAKLLFRLKGGYFAIGTWVMAEVFHLWISGNTDWSGGGLGRSLQAARLIQPPHLRISMVYIAAVVIGIGAVMLVYYLMRSRTGLGLTAIRDSEAGAQNLGVDTNRLKLVVYMIAAAGTAIVGAIIYLSLLNIIPKAAFSVNWTAYMLFIVVIGGIGTLEGPIIGTVIFFVIRQYLSDYGEWSFILLGSIAVSVMLFAPKGLWGLLRGSLQTEFFPIRRRLPPELMNE